MSLAEFIISAEEEVTVQGSECDIIAAILKKLTCMKTPLVWRGRHAAASATVPLFKVHALLSIYWKKKRKKVVWKFWINCFFWSRTARPTLWQFLWWVHCSWLKKYCRLRPKLLQYVTFIPKLKFSLKYILCLYCWLPRSFPFNLCRAAMSWINMARCFEFLWMIGPVWCSGPHDPAAEQGGIPGMTRRGSCVSLFGCTALYPCKLLCHLRYCWFWQGGKKKHSLRMLWTRPSPRVNHSVLLVWR